MCVRDVGAVLPVLTLVAVVFGECCRPIPALHGSIILLWVTVRRGKIWACGGDIGIEYKLYLVSCRQDSSRLLLHRHAC